MRLAFVIAFIFFVSVASAQTTFKAVVKNAETSEPLPGATATLKGTALGASANEDGLVEIQNIPDGPREIEFSFIGYETRTIAVTFPLQSSEPMEILLEGGEEELEEVVITSTRSSRTIADLPTRVEFIAGEE